MVHDCYEGLDPVDTGTLSEQASHHEAAAQNRNKNCGHAKQAAENEMMKVRLNCTQHCLAQWRATITKAENLARLVCFVRHTST